MRCEQKFLRCAICGNTHGVLKSTGVEVICCGQPMEELTANTADAAQEKHVPAVTGTEKGIVVSVGSMAHPMLEEHYIEWVYVQTEKGGQRKCMFPGQEPRVEFAFINDKPVAVFAYCNLHGLWKADVK